MFRPYVSYSNDLNPSHTNAVSTLTELPGEAGAALQRRVVEGVPAVHDSGVGRHLDASQRQQVGVLQGRPPCSVLDAPLQRAEAAVLGVADDFDSVMLRQAV